MSLSIGLVPISEQSGGVGEVLKQADVACYAAKDAGRNRVHVFLQHDDNYMQQHHGEMSWVNKINYALDHDRFILYAQIISPLHADLEPHYEILIRMLGENDEIISPGAFLPTVGCRFSIDDFGSGLSSFDYLKKLPVDYLKIDGIFVKDIIDDPVDLALVKSINEIGHIMGKQTIAEFVENQAILNELNNIGVDFVQGYHVGRPHPLSELRIV